MINATSALNPKTSPKIANYPQLQYHIKQPFPALYKNILPATNTGIINNKEAKDGDTVIINGKKKTLAGIKKRPQDIKVEKAIQKITANADDMIKRAIKKANEVSESLKKGDGQITSNNKNYTKLTETLAGGIKRKSTFLDSKISTIEETLPDNKKNVYSFSDGKLFSCKEGVETLAQNCELIAKNLHLENGKPALYTADDKHFTDNSAFECLESVVFEDGKPLEYITDLKGTADYEYISGIWLEFKNEKWQLIGASTKNLTFFNHP